MPERCEPGGEASSQERKPVSASSVMAELNVVGVRLHPVSTGLP